MVTPWARRSCRPRRAAGFAHIAAAAAPLPRTFKFHGGGVDAHAHWRQRLDRCGVGVAAAVARARRHVIFSRTHWRGTGCLHFHGLATLTCTVLPLNWLTRGTVLLCTGLVGMATYIEPDIRCSKASSGRADGILPGHAVDGFFDRPGDAFDSTLAPTISGPTVLFVGAGLGVMRRRLSTCAALTCNSEPAPCAPWLVRVLPALIAACRRRHAAGLRGGLGWCSALGGLNCAPLPARSRPPV